MNRRDVLKGIVAGALALLVPKTEIELVEPDDFYIIQGVAYNSCRAAIVNKYGVVMYQDGGFDSGWIQAPPIPHNATSTCIAMTAFCTWYVGFSDGSLWKTIDAGETWFRFRYSTIAGSFT